MKRKKRGYMADKPKEEPPSNGETPEGTSQVEGEGKPTRKSLRQAQRKAQGLPPKKRTHR